MLAEDAVADLADTRMVAEEATLGNCDIFAHFGEGDGLPHFGLGETSGVGLGVGERALLSVCEATCSLIVAVPGVFFHFAGYSDGSAVVVDGSVEFGGGPGDGVVGVDLGADGASEFAGGEEE